MKWQIELERHCDKYKNGQRKSNTYITEGPKKHQSKQENNKSVI